MRSDLEAKIKILNEQIWEHRITWPDVEHWLDNFAPDPQTGFGERLHALFLLSNFTFFNSHLMRALLRAMYRDLILQPFLVKLRRARHGTMDLDVLGAAYKNVLRTIRFVGIGNPSESGTHLLYYFRQENELATRQFTHLHDLFEVSATQTRLIRGVKHIIFIDDFCGSGSQATRYSKQYVERIKQLSPRTKTYYYSLFATSKGLARVRSQTRFDKVETVCELDDSFEALAASSRYFRDGTNTTLDRNFCRVMCQTYGQRIAATEPLGFEEGQLLLGFAHNIPNNTLPIFWAEGPSTGNWQPIFRRYNKVFRW